MMWFPLGESYSRVEEKKATSNFSNMPNYGTFTPGRPLSTYSGNPAKAAPKPTPSNQLKPK